VGEVNGRPFLNVASVGLGSAVTRRLTATAKQRWGVLSYPRALVDALRASRSFRARIRCGAEEHAVRSIQIAVGNGRFYGGGVPVAEDASIDDGRLDLYSIAPQPLHRLVVMAVAVRLGRQREFAGVKSLRGAEIGIDTRRPMRLSVDGELEARTPARFRVRPGALAVFVPEEGGAGGAPGLEGGHP
jgi:diacylglycerol kinase family enzyme